MWAFATDARGYHEGPSTTKLAKTFDVDDFLATIFRPQDALVHAASLNQLEVVRKWISRGHNVNELDKEGHLALCVAAQNQCLEVMRLLLEHGADCDLAQADGKTPLHIACTWGRLEAATLLIQHGATLTIRDREGQLPLHGASRNGHIPIVRRLLDTGIDPHVADECGSTPLDLARDWVRTEILQIFQDYQVTTFRPRTRLQVCLLLRRLQQTSDRSSPGIPELPVSIVELLCSFIA